MARYQADYTTAQSDEWIRQIAEDFFKREGFVQKEYKGKLVWKKGSGWLAAPQYIQLEYGQGRIHIEAFLRWVILPGVYGGEMGLSGFWGFAVKAMLQERVNNLIRLLCQPAPYAAGYPSPAASPADPQSPAAIETTPAASMPGTAPVEGMPPAVPAPASPAAGQQPAAPWTPATPYRASPAGAPVPAGYGTAYPSAYPSMAVSVPAAPDRRGSAVAGFILSLLGAVGWFWPLVGIILSILGLIFSGRGRKSSAKGLALAGLILGGIFLAVSVIDGICALLLWILS